MSTFPDLFPTPSADLPETPDTPLRLSVGGSADSALETGGDRDWMALPLAAGQQVRITVTGRSLEDPYLRLFDAEGRLIDENDDTDGFDPVLDFVAETVQTVYVEVSGFSPLDAGTYTVSVRDLSVTREPGMTSLTDTLDWGSALADSDVTYYFAPAGFSADGYTSEGLNAYEQSRFEAAFALIAEAADLTFTQVFGPASADFVLLGDSDEIGGDFLAYFNPPGEVAAGVGVFDVTLWDRAPGGDLEAGAFAFITITHEVLHGLGLAHPHDDGGGSPRMQGVFLEEGQYGPHLLNQGVYTTMSYNTGYVTGGPGTQGDPDDLWGYEIGPMALDIAVLQRKYGANDRHATGDDRYVLPTQNAPGTGWRAIWDAGGIDEIAHDGAGDAVIDLRPATLVEAPGGGGYLSAMAGVAGGFTIAAGVMIEAATGGSGDDLLQGNDGDNRLTGGPGDDTLRGGAGVDVAVIDAARLSVTARALPDGVALEGPDGADQLFGIETVAFRDGDVATAALIAGSGPDADARGGPGLRDAGSGGPDRLSGGPGDDTLTGRGGSDVLEGGAGWDSLDGGVGFDTLTGGAGHDTLVGREGFDSLLGGSGDDRLTGNFGNDTADGGTGDDTLIGGLGFDSLAGGDGGDLIEGRDGFDTLDGGAGADTLQGNNGNDSLDGGAGDDRVQGGLGADTLEGREGNDTLEGANGFDVLNGGAGHDVLIGGAGDDTLTGETGNDALRGGAGRDSFVFVGGADRITDFQAGLDAIVLDSALLPDLGTGTAEAALRAVSALDGAGNLVLDFGTDSLTLIGVRGLDVILDDVLLA
ncbi:M10 family metallopeptidase [Cognatishimia sp. F0-27]|uniref:M10 family metallopeptidase n=1 Tax=Cognatishimia sp. F0-27 TaxID=2816855 RepID=UPI001DB0122D|nr:M10 family metallopeptidase C-terminal domain-containing protein [Cognatishimia sp. F0-27]MCC1494741.1 M10 family metallopeptidase C-terminal domain-containing protein [Cognatishimia sp. F0-27]